MAATRAALQEGIVPGGGVALLNASQKIKPNGLGEELLLKAIKSPYKTILDNANLPYIEYPSSGVGVDVVNEKSVRMINKGIIDPVLVTKTALKNAVSVVNTIFSADCVINNIRINESN